MSDEANESEESQKKSSLGCGCMKIGCLGFVVIVFLALGTLAEIIGVGTLGFEFIRRFLLSLSRDY